MPYRPRYGTGSVFRNGARDILSRPGVSYLPLSATHGPGSREGEIMKKTPNPVDKHVGSRVRMRRLMLSLSQEKLGDALGLTFQQIQKYEKGTNRIGASRLQHMSGILQVPVSFFFEGAPRLAGDAKNMSGGAPSPTFVSEFLATSEGLALMKAFSDLKSAKLRRSIVHLVEEIADADEG
jgi:transcriptional regulator with XRE-family HTH domain